MAVNTENLILSEVDSVRGYDNNGDLLFIIDELQDFKIANTEDKSDVTGKGSRRLKSIKKNKAVTISGTNGVFSGGLAAVQVGTDVQNDADAQIDWYETLTVNSNAATTSFKAVGTAGAEIKAYKKLSNGAAGEALTQVASTPETGKFTYMPDTKALAFKSGDLADGTEIIVCYKRKIKAAVVSNISDNYSKTCRLVADVVATDTCDNAYHAQFQIPRADFSGTFDFSMGGDQMVHTFEANSLVSKGGCGGSGSGSTSKLWDMILFEDGVADAT